MIMMIKLVPRKAILEESPKRSEQELARGPQTGGKGLQLPPIASRVLRSKLPYPFLIERRGCMRHSFEGFQLFFQD